MNLNGTIPQPVLLSYLPLHSPWRHIFLTIPIPTMDREHPIGAGDTDTDMDSAAAVSVAIGGAAVGPAHLDDQDNNEDGWASADRRRGPGGAASSASSSPLVPRMAAAAAMQGASGSIPPSPSRASSARAGGPSPSPRSAIYCPARRCSARDAGLRQLAAASGPPVMIPRHQALMLRHQQMWMSQVMMHMGRERGAVESAGHHHTHRGHDHRMDCEGDDGGDGPSGKLLQLVEDHRWIPSLNRITTNPEETTRVGIQGRTP